MLSAFPYVTDGNSSYSKGRRFLYLLFINYCGPVRVFIFDLFYFFQLTIVRFNKLNLKGWFQAHKQIIYNL